MTDEEWEEYKESLRSIPREELEHKVLTLTSLLEMKKILVAHYEELIKEYRCLQN